MIDLKRFGISIEGKIFMYDRRRKLLIPRNSDGLCWQILKEFRTYMAIKASPDKERNWFAVVKVRRRRKFSAPFLRSDGTKENLPILSVVEVDQLIAGKAQGWRTTELFVKGRAELLESQRR